MRKRVILITGSTDGIGKQTAKELAKTGATILLHGRNASKGQQTVSEISQATGNANIDFFKADLASLQEVRKMAADVKKKYPQINVLINNAGVFENNFRKSKDGFEMTFAVNYLAHFLLTCLLLDRLCANAPSRIINVASMAHSNSLDFDNLQGEKGYSGYTAYSYSKLENILFTFKLAEMVNKSKVTVNCLHPGVINTKLLRAGWGMGGASVEQGARTSVYLATAPEIDGITGKYFFDMQGERRPANIAYDKSVQNRLWQISERLSGCSFSEALKQC